MLKPVYELNRDDRVTCLLADWVTFDREADIRLLRSRGQRRYGRPARYWLRLPDCDRAKGFTASTDDEAITKANAILAKEASHA